MAPTLLSSPTQPILVVPAPPTAVLPPSALQQLREHIQWFRQFESPLTPRDTFMLSVLGLRRVLERARLPRKAEPQLDVMVTCFNHALHAVASFDPGFAGEAGILLRRVYIPVAQLEPWLDKQVQSWAAEMEDIITRGLVGGSGLTTGRERVLFAFAEKMSGERLASLREFLARVRVGSHAASKLRNEKRTRDEERPAELLSDLMAAIADADGDFLRIMMVNAEGKFVPGAHQVRDHLPTKQVIDPVSTEDLPSDDPKQPEKKPQIADKRAEQPFLELLDREERVVFRKALRVFVQKRFSHEKPGSARYVVLERLAELVEGRVSQADIVSASGLTGGAISRAVAQVGSAMLAEPGLRPFLGRLDVFSENQ